MKLTYYSQTPARGLMVILSSSSGTSSSGYNTYVVSSCIFRNVEGLRNLLFQVIQEADFHQKTLLYDVSRLYPGEVDIVRSFSFVPISALNSHIFVRDAKTDQDSVAYCIQPLVEDRDGNYHAAVKYDQGTHYAVLNVYGQRIDVFDTEEAAQALLTRRV